MTKYKSRIADKILKDKLDAKGAVLIEGAKWCGKTTTASTLSNSIVSLDDPVKYQEFQFLVDSSPMKLLEGETPVLLDEWQLVPKLWDAIRHEVDKRNKVGQFILTGSAVPIESSDIKHSGIGRFSRLLMRTMTLYESNDSNGQVSLSNLFKGTKDIDGKANINLDKLAYLICRGGWPFAIDLNTKASLQQAVDYYDAVVNSDINRADGVSKKKENVQLLLRSLSRNQGSQCSIATIKNDIEHIDGGNLSQDLLIRYINALKMIYVIEDMPAWNPNLRSKVAIRTSNTRYFSDPSIACASLEIGPSDLVNDLQTMGLLFESMCMRDLRVYAQALNGQVYHYRDKNDLECDAVVHLKHGLYGLVEIKLGGETLISQGAKTLNDLERKIDTKTMNTPAFKMVLTGVGNYAYQRNDGVYVVPIGCLKD